MGDTDQVLTSAEAAAYLKISLRTLMKLRSAGEGPPGVQVGRQWRYSRTALEAWLARRAPWCQEGD